MCYKYLNCKFSILDYSVICLLILTLAEIGLCNNPIIVSDETFNNSDWESFIFHDTTPQQNASYTAYQKLTGGNPNAYRYVSHTWTGDGIGSKQIAVAHIMTSNIYDPNDHGPISSIDCSFDAIFINDVDPHAVGYYPIIRQNGIYYRYGYRNVVAQTWEHFPFLNSRMYDWVRLYPDSGSNYPDFSESGNPIYFGYVSYNGTGGNHTLTTESGIDNFVATVYPYCGCDLVGDINHDCMVDIKDFALLASNWLKVCE